MELEYIIHADHVVRVLNTSLFTMHPPVSRCAGAVLSSKAQSDGELHHARKEARRIIHAYHKAQDKMETTVVQ